MTTLTLMSRKGGSGKSTLTACIAAGLSKAGRSVRILDTDPQHSLTHWRQQTASSHEVIACDTDAVPTLLKSRSHEVNIIDSAPLLDLSLYKLAMLSDLVIIPVKPSLLDVLALASLIKMLKTTSAKAQAVLTMVPASTSPSELDDIRGAITDQGIDVMTAKMGLRKVYSASLTAGMTPHDFRPLNRQAINEIDAICAEITSIID